MAKRRRLGRRGFLTGFFLPFIAFAFFLSAGSVFGSELELRIQTLPENALVNGIWTLSILVNHPSPNEVLVTPPFFPQSLALQTMRIESRFFQGQVWTFIEYSFTPLQSGEIILPPFTVSAPGRIANTGYISAFFQPPPSEEVIVPHFRWLTPVPQAALFERVELVLELFDWEESAQAPGGLFQGRAPENAIVSDAPPVYAGEGIFRYTVSLIPLEEGEVILQPFLIQSSGLQLLVPGIVLEVALVPPQLSAPQLPVMQEYGDIPLPPLIAVSERESHIPFPVLQTGRQVFSPLQEEYDTIVHTVTALWEDNRKALALAEIRRNERDSLSGPFLVPLRREMERLLLLEDTINERWQPLPIVFTIRVSAVLLLSAVIVFLVFRFFSKRKLLSKKHFYNTDEQERTVTSSRRRGFSVVLFLAFAMTVFLIGVEALQGTHTFQRFAPVARTAVLEGAYAFRIPDEQGAVSAWFDKGQPVTVGALSMEWGYVRSPDGRSGWVKAGAIINY